MKVTVTGKTAEVTERETLTIGSVGVVIDLSFSEEWALFASITAQFYNGGTPLEVPVFGDSVELPMEMAREQKPVSIVLIGKNEDGTKVYPTVETSLGNLWYGIREGTEKPEKPSPDWQTQIEGAVNTANKNASEALENTKDLDNRVTELEENGGTGGTTDYDKLTNKPSINGHELRAGMTSQELGIKDGKDGESAYQIARRLGFSGTEAEWLDSLRYDHSEEFTQLADQVKGYMEAAGSSASAAAGSAEAASDSAAAAKAQVEEAARQVGLAAEQATAAGQQAEAAAGSADTAQGQAEEAARQAGLAGDQAAEAQRQAEGAAGSAATAGQKAEAAAGSAEAAKTEADRAKTEADRSVALGLTSVTPGDLIRVKSVDASGVPTAWEKTSLEELGGKWERIDSITLESDTILSLTNEPSGKLYRFKALRIVLLPSGSFTYNNIYVMPMTTVGGQDVGRVEIAEGDTYAALQVLSDRYAGFISYALSGKGKPPYPLKTSPTFRSSANNPLQGIYSTNALKKGDKIIVEGVRTSD